MAIFGSPLFLTAATPIKASLSGSQNNLNLKSWLIANTFWDGVIPHQKFEVTIESGTVIGSTSTGNASMVIAAFPTGSKITLIINGKILGRGGNGGEGGDSPALNGQNGFAGGNAVDYDQEFSVDGNGVLGGGGGGGGGGAAESTGPGITSGGGGGGGAGSQGGNGGPAGDFADQFGGNGQPGTETAGGSGGIQGSNGEGDTSGVGGNGGGLATAGSTGGQETPNNPQNPGSGGAGGKAANRTSGSGTVIDISGGSLTIAGATI